MSFTTGIHNSTLNHLFYVCKVRVYPNGRLLQYSYPQGHTSYWFHRLRVNIRFNSCADYLIIGFVPEEITQPTLLPEELNLTCTSKFPYVIDSNHRIVSLVWHTATGSTEQVTSQVDVQMSAYMRFEGTFSISDKILRCEAGSGFWCGNDTAVCVYGQMRCDQADGCFDGGTDEVGCPPPRNYTSAPPRRMRSSLSTYLPWTALGIIPLILLFVLGLICTPRKTLDDFDDDAEADALKVNSPPSSSTTNSASNSSGSASPNSTHSAMMLSRTDEKLMTTQKRLFRWTSQPDHICGDYELIPLSTGNAKRCKTVDPIRECRSTATGARICSSSGHPHNRVPTVRTFRAVSFQLPSDETADTWNAKPRGYPHEPKATNGRKHDHIPASCDDSRLLQKKRSSLSCVTKMPTTTVKVADAWPRTISTGVSNSGLSLSNVSRSSSNSTESDREDCTPFRRPDGIVHDPVTSIRLKKPMVDHVNGFVAHAINLEPNRFLDHTVKSIGTSHQPELPNTRLSKPKFPSSTENSHTNTSEYIVL